MKLYQQRTLEQLELSMAKALGLVKLMCGVGNNAAWLIVLEAHDHIRQLPQYKHKVRFAYQNVFLEWKKYERNLLYASSNQFFHVADMDDECRKRYGNITDQEYYEFWTGTGARAYTEVTPRVTSLWNKYRLSLLNHDVPNADGVAWSMTGMAALELACQIYQSAIKVTCETWHVRDIMANSVFKALHLRRVADAWQRAMLLTYNQTFDLTEQEERNIELGLEWLQDGLTDFDIVYDSMGNASKDFAEVFRTKGEMKKFIRQINELKQFTKDD